MSYTLDNIQKAPSYEALKRNGFSDSDVVSYYQLISSTARNEFFQSIKLGLRGVRPTPTFEKTGTQKCTAKALYPMFMDKMNQDFTYQGQTFNLIKSGWRFEFNTRRKALGVCNRRKKIIYISKWFIENSNTPYEEWVDTILHEIAHAIDSMVRGTSDHSWKWKQVAIAVGAKPTRCADDNVKTDPKAHKYTMSCPNCKKETGYSRRPKREKACGKCCIKHSGGRYDERFKMKLTQNY